MNKNNLPSLLSAGLIWLVLVTAALLSRNLMPLDETRYVSVAWEMWIHGDWLVPHLNGETYSHKPPLFFWLIHLGWAIFGLNDWWPRLVPALFQLASIFLATRLAQLLWPEPNRVYELVPPLLMTGLFWAAFTATAMFDFLITFFVLLGVYGVFIASRYPKHGWFTVGIAIGLGILAKGPVILLHVLPVALLAPVWLSKSSQSWFYWYRGIGIAILIGAAIALSWAIPAAIVGGTEYGSAIFWGQTAGRIVNSFRHQHPWWWYLPWFPVILFPWLLWPSLWRGITRLFKTQYDQGSRFCITWIASVFILMSLVSGKQLHYLLPLFPGFALLASRSLGMLSDWKQPVRQWLSAAILIGTGSMLTALPFLAPRFSHTPWLSGISPFWGVLLLVAGISLWTIHIQRLKIAIHSLAWSIAFICIVINLSIVSQLGPTHDLTRISRQLADYQQADLPIAHISKYHGQYHFLGRLLKPLDVIRDFQLSDWVKDHPDGMVVVYYSDPSRQFTMAPEYCQLFRGGLMAIWPGKLLAQQPQLLND